MASGVLDGQLANQETFNAAFLARNGDSDTIGRVDLLSDQVSSGGHVHDIQRNINSICSALGISTDQAYALLITWANSYVGSTSSSAKDKIEALVNKFLATGGHAHTGVNGDADKVDFSNLLGVNQFKAAWQMVSVAGVVGTSKDVSLSFTGKLSGGASAQAGVITTTALNNTPLYDSTTNTYIEDAQGQRVYGRLTYSTGVWTLSFYTNEAGTETAYSFGSSTNINVFYREVFHLANIPTIESSPADFGTLDITADVVDATALVRGVVNTLAQTFAGLKTFNGGIATDTVAEKTVNAGVTVDGVLLKDGLTDGRDVSVDGTTLDNHVANTSNPHATTYTQVGADAAGSAAAAQAYAIQRANHTGTQLASTISDFASTVLATVLTGLSLATNAAITASDTVLGALGKLQKQITDHLADTSNPHATTKTQVGLSNVDNTSDASKNVLSATKLTTARTINGISFDGTANITVADATKEPTITSGTTSQYWRGDKTFQTLDNSAVGLSNVTNDAQLKRSANDFSSFTQKTTPVGADIVLIEDSAASGVKKYSTITALVTAGGGGGGSTSPGGSTTQVQFNDGGVFGGDTGLIYDKTNKRLGVGGATGSYTVQAQGATAAANLQSNTNGNASQVWLSSKSPAGTARSLVLQHVPANTLGDSYFNISGNSNVAYYDNGNFIINGVTRRANTNVLEINCNNANDAMAIFQGGAGEGAEFIFQSSEGSVSSPTATAANKILGDFRFNGYGASSYVSGALIRAQQTAAITGGNAPTKMLFYQTNDAGSFNNTFEMNRNGVLFGYNSHNPTGATGFGSAAPAFYSGTYTPTFTAVNAVAANTVYAMQYSRVGNTVTVSGKVDVTPTGAATVSFNITVPVAAVNFTSNIQAAGAGTFENGVNAYIVVRMTCDVGTSAMRVAFVAPSATAGSIFLTFTYQVI